MTTDIAGQAASGVDFASTVAELRAGFDSGLTRPLGWRRAQLDGLAALLTEHERDIAAALASDLGKSAGESYLTETGLALAEVRHVRRSLRWWRGAAADGALATVAAVLVGWQAHGGL